MQKMELHYWWKYDNEETRILITQFILYFACCCWSVQGIWSDLNRTMIIISAGSRMQLTTMAILLALKRIWVSNMISLNFPFLFFMIYLFFIFFVIIVVVIFAWLFMFIRMAVAFAVVFALWHSAENDPFKINLFTRDCRIVVK